MKKKKIWITILIILIVGVSCMAFFSQGMKKQYQKEVREALGQYTQTSQDLLTEQDIAQLPAQVQTYIRMTGAIGQPKVWNMRAEMGGKMRNDDKSAWMTIQSVQYNFMANPVRMFYIKGKMFGLPAYGLHSYKKEQAFMLIKALGIVPVVNQRGKEMNESDTVTILNDMCIFAPSTLIDRRITWRTIDANTVEAQFTNGSKTVRAQLFFDKDGKLINFVSDDRYRSYDKARWSTPIHSYKTYGAFTLPATASAVWEMKDRAFSYAEFEVKKVEYNVSVLR